jgi:hypothetical protein
VLWFHSAIDLVRTSEQFSPKNLPAAAWRGADPTSAPQACLFEKDAYGLGGIVSIECPLGRGAPRRRAIGTRLRSVVRERNMPERGLSQNGGRSMTDQQFREICLHLRILIALPGSGVGIIGVFAWEYL